MDNAYRALQEALHGIGAATTIRDLGGGLVQLVCAATTTRRGLAGNSFWLARTKANVWFLVTWTNHYWAFPTAVTPADIALACRDLLPVSKTPVYSVPDEIAQKHSLVESADDPFE